MLKFILCYGLGHSEVASYDADIDCVKVPFKIDLLVCETVKGLAVEFVFRHDILIVGFFDRSCFLTDNSAHRVFCDT